MSDEVKKDPGVSRRDLLKGIAVGALGLDKVFSNPFEEKPRRDNTSRLVDRGFKHDLREALRTEEIDWVRQVIEKYHKPPFRGLRDFVPVDRQTHGLAQHVSIHLDPKTGVNYLSWGIRGGGDESDLIKNLNLWCEADLEPSGRISKLSVRINLNQSFGTGLTPETDPYINTIGEEKRIAAKDLREIIDKVYNRPNEDATDLFRRDVIFREFSVRKGPVHAEFTETFQFENPEDRLRQKVLFEGRSDGVVGMTITRFPHTERPVA